MKSATSIGCYSVLALSWDSRWVGPGHADCEIVEKDRPGAYFLNGTTSPCPPLRCSRSMMGEGGWGLCLARCFPVVSCPHGHTLTLVSCVLTTCTLYLTHLHDSIGCLAVEKAPPPGH